MEQVVEQKFSSLVYQLSGEQVRWPHQGNNKDSGRTIFPHQGAFSYFARAFHQPTFGG